MSVVQGNLIDGYKELKEDNEWPKLKDDTPTDCEYSVALNELLERIATALEHIAARL